MEDLRPPREEGLSEWTVLNVEVLRVEVANLELEKGRVASSSTPEYFTPRLSEGTQETAGAMDNLKVAVFSGGQTWRSGSRVFERGSPGAPAVPFCGYCRSGQTPSARWPWASSRPRRAGGRETAMAPRGGGATRSCCAVRHCRAGPGRRRGAGGDLCGLRGRAAARQDHRGHQAHPRRGHGPAASRSPSFTRTRSCPSSASRRRWSRQLMHMREGTRVRDRGFARRRHRRRSRRAGVDPDIGRLPGRGDRLVEALRGGHRRGGAAVRGGLPASEEEAEVAPGTWQSKGRESSLSPVA